jgi:hypothetical protein
MYQNLSSCQAAEILYQDNCAAFSREGALSLVLHLEFLKKPYGTKIELDCVDLRCSYTEYESILQAAKAYHLEIPRDYCKDDWAAYAFEWFEDRTTVIRIPGEGEKVIILDL